MSIPASQFVDADTVEGWNISLWGNPKLTIVCGGCHAMFKTKDYLPITNMDNEYAANCPKCNKWNQLGLYPKE